jgi:hypothetical protein
MPFYIIYVNLHASRKPSRRNLHIDSMAPSLAVSVISLDDFQEVLSRYNALIQSVSKPSNKDGKSLQELDTYRLLTVPTQLKNMQQDGGELYLEKEEVESLIRWKLYVYPLHITLLQMIIKGMQLSDH